MKYTKKYNADELHEMFANFVDNDTLASWNTSDMAKHLKELAPDMNDSEEVAKAIKNNATRNLSS